MFPCLRVLCGPTHLHRENVPSMSCRYVHELFIPEGVPQHYVEIIRRRRQYSITIFVIFTFLSAWYKYCDNKQGFLATYDPSWFHSRQFTHPICPWSSFSRPNLSIIGRVTVSRVWNFLSRSPRSLAATMPTVPVAQAGSSLLPISAK